MPLPNDLPVGAFSLQDAAEIGLTRGRLRRPDIQRPHRGLYSFDSAGDLYERCLQLAPLLGPHRLFSHVTAARLWGIPLPFEWTANEPLHVMTLPGAEPIRRPGVVGWESRDHVDATLWNDVAVVAPAAVWAQLSVPGALGRDEWSGARRAVSEDWLVAAGDYLLTGPRRVGGRMPLCQPSELSDVARAHRGKRGAKALAAALERVRPGPQSPRESLLRLGLIDHGLPEPTIQPDVATAVGIRHPDLGYVDRRILIEYQGDHHRTDQAQWREDLARKRLFEDAGFRVFEATADVFADGCQAFAQIIRRALSR